MQCPYCKSKDTYTYFRIEKMPNILSACSRELLVREKILPFEAKLCRNCSLGFNSKRLTRDDLNFIYDNYLYISPMRGIGRTKYDEFLSNIKKYCSMDDMIVEIGCSEGYLLSRLRQWGYRNLIGIEPGPQADYAEALGLTISKEYFNENTFQGKTIDCFILMHVFEHFINPFSIIEAMKKQMTLFGKIILEVPYFTGHQHHHLFFYNITFLRRLCLEKKLKIIDINKNNDVIRVVITHMENGEYKEDKSVIEEKILELASEQYAKFKNIVIKVKKLLRKKRKVYWWGTGTSSVILLNQIDKDILEKSELIVVDGSKDKWGKYIPGLGIQVYPFTILKDRSVDCLIVASSFFNEISNTLKESNVYVKDVKVFI